MRAEAVAGATGASGASGFEGASGGVGSAGALMAGGAPRSYPAFAAPRHHAAAHRCHGVIPSGFFGEPLQALQFGLLAFPFRETETDDHHTGSASGVSGGPASSWSPIRIPPFPPVAWLTRSNPV